MSRRLSQSRGDQGQGGAIILFVLFVAVAIAVLAQALSVAVISAQRGRDAEITGRELLAEKEQALLDVRERLLGEWTVHAWAPAADGPPGVSTMVEPISGGSDWALDASAAHPAGTSPVVLSAWVERGRDGLDLPMAGLVARGATWTQGRETQCVEIDAPPEPSGAEGEAAPPDRPVAWLVDDAEALPLGAGLKSEALTQPWSLDGGWRDLFGRWGRGETTSGLRPGSSVTVLAGRKGGTVAWPSGLVGEAGTPILVVVVGGADVDARDLGDVHGVIVCDGGGVSLEGTRVHGGVFASGEVDFGSTGTVLFAPDIVRWAADRSLGRARLVPGSRREAVE